MTVKNEWAAWSDTFNSYSLAAGIGTESEIRHKIHMEKPYSLNQSDWRAVRIPPPGTIEVLEEVEVLAASGNWFNEPLAREVLNRVRAVIAKTDGQST